MTGADAVWEMRISDLWTEVDDHGAEEFVALVTADSDFFGGIAIGVAIVLATTMAVLLRRVLRR